MSDTLADLMFGPSHDDRPCGECIACCVLPKIDTPELRKPEGQVCPNCTGSGCFNSAAKAWASTSSEPLPTNTCSGATL